MNYYEDDDFGPWFPLGSYVRFVGENGNRYERERAEQVFSVGQIYKVVASHTYKSTSDVMVEGNSNEWNTVMFERVDKPVATIEDWYMVATFDGCSLGGILPNGHPTNPDFKNVLTSSIVTSTPTVVETLNTIYQLGKRALLAVP